MEVLYLSGGLSVVHALDMFGKEVFAVEDGNVAGLVVWAWSRAAAAF